MFELSLSNNVRLRLLEIRHAEEFFELVQRNFERLVVWCPWLDRVETIETTRAFLSEKIERFAAGNGFTAGMFRDGRLVGVIALEYIDNANSLTEIGYWIDADAEGNGLTIEACRSVIAHAFRDLGLRRVQIRCASENHRSRAIPEKLGFREEGIVRQCERLRDRTVDLVIYGMLSEEWLTTPEAASGE